MALVRTPDLGAARAHQQRRGAFRRRRIAGDFGDGRAARVVAVIAHAGAEKQFGLVERTERHREFRAADGALGYFPNSPAAASNSPRRRNNRRASRWWSAASRSNAPCSRHRFRHCPRRHGRARIFERNWRCDGVAQSKIDVVVAALHPEHGFGRHVEQRTVDGARDADAAVNAIVVLMELIAVVAVGRIVEVPSVIVEQIQLVFDQISIGLPRSVVDRIAPCAPTAKSGWCRRRRSDRVRHKDRFVRSSGPAAPPDRWNSRCWCRPSRSRRSRRSRCPGCSATVR